MESDQQFCLRWNNHQSTVLGVLNSLLDNGWLADCMIAAEGRSMKAHRFVLTACSPYFQSLLDQNYDRHPIIILKDIKYDELVAMMDYMYRGVVNTSQDKLSSLLAAAESLQIKGLSDTGESKEPTDNRPYESFQQAPSPPALPQRPGLTIEQRHPKQDIQMSLVRGQQPNSPMAMPVTSYRMTESREGSMSPIPRKRKKARRHDSVCDEASQSYGGMENHSTSDSMEMPSQMPAIHTNFTIMPATSTPSVPTANEPEIKSSPVDLAEAEILNRGGATSMGEPSPRRVSAEEDQNLEPPGALLIPKAEYIEEDIKEDSVEEVTLDDDLTDDMDHAQAGPSHGGDGSGSQGFAPWHVAGDQSTDEVFLAAQEAVGTHRDPQDFSGDMKRWSGWSVTRGDVLTSVEYKPEVKIGDKSRTSKSSKKSVTGRRARGIFPCEKCGRTYIRKDSLQRHLHWECGKEPTFQCPFCPQRCKRKAHQIRHIRRQHKELMNSPAAERSVSLPLDHGSPDSIPG